MLFENPGADKIPELREKTSCLRTQRNQRPIECAIDQDNLLAIRKKSSKLVDSFAGARSQLGEAVEDRGVVLEGFVENDVINPEGIQGFRFCVEVGDAVLNRCIDDCVLIGPKGDVLPVPLEQVLIHPAFFIEDPKHSCNPACEIFNRICVEAFVIDALDAQNDPEIAALGEEDFIVHKAEEIHLRAQRGGLVIILRDLRQLKHGPASAPEQGRTSSGRTVCESSWSSAETAESAGRSASPTARTNKVQKISLRPRPNCSTD